MKEILAGCIDMHVHTAPDTIPRKVGDLELATEAASRGMRALLIKSHNFPTVGNAYVASQAVAGIKVFGSIALNFAVGGLNPAAVEASLKAGAKEVWMPTVSAQNHPSEKSKAIGLSVTDSGGHVKAEVKEILKIIAEHDGILGTGHISSREIMTLVPEAKAVGVKKIVVTHPEFPPISLSLEEQLELREFGVFFERTYVSTTPPGGNVSIRFLLDGIKTVGAECTILSTDFGQPVNPSPVVGMENCIKDFLALGVSEKDLDLMVKVNPAQLLGI